MKQKDAIVTLAASTGKSPAEKISQPRRSAIQITAKTPFSHQKESLARHLSVDKVKNAKKEFKVPQHLEVELRNESECC